jgi:hypothetical protein
MPTSLEDKQNGFMNAIGLLLEKCSSSTVSEIKSTLSNFDLLSVIQNGGHDDAASSGGVNPCGPNQTWDPTIGACIPN